MKKIFYNLVILLLFSTSVILYLYVSTKTSDAGKNGFVRNFKLNPTTNISHQDLKFNSFYIAGISEKYIYLGNYTAPLLILKVDPLKKDTQVYKIAFITDDTIKTAKISIDSQIFFLTDNIQHKIWSGSLIDMIAHRLSYNVAWLSPITEFNNGSFVMKTLNENKSGVLLTKESGKTVVQNKSLLQKQVDGFFCTDGSLLYNKLLSRFIYIYFYRNQFIVTDTNLNLQYRGKTVDTIAHAHIKVANIKSEHSLTLAEHPLVVNKKCSSSNNKLIVVSDIVADNQDRIAVKDSTIFDVYDLSENKYKFSFEIKDWNGNKLSDFFFSNNTIFALYDRYLIKYDLQSSLFSD